MRNVIVTGGSRGLGLGLARRLTRAGYRVIALARKETNQLTLAMEEAERAHRGSFHFVPFDLAEPAAIAALVKSLRNAHGPIYGLVNNAAVGFDGVLALMPNTQIEQLVRMNTLSPIVLTKYVVRAMMADGGGRIVNVASIVGFTGYSGLSGYGATKASMLGFTRSLAREVGRMGVTVNSIAPGFLDTDMTQGLHDEHRQQIVRRSALRRLAEAPALLSEGECLTYRGLAARANRYARWALDRGLVKGNVVGLFMPNRPEYMAIWLGITRIGGVVALLNTNLAGAALAHAVNLVAPRHVIVAAELLEPFTRALPDLAGAPRIWAHGDGPGDFPRIDGDIERLAGDALGAAEARPTTIEDRALYIYTSGTTGLPQAARGSHARLMQWSHWFAGMMDTRASDRMYNCLPMYHSVGGVLATGAVLVGGGSVVILEFYASTEGNVSMVNVEGKPGAIGRIPAFLAHRFPAALVRFDVARDEPVRNEAGFCVRCAPNEVGEAIGKVLEEPSNAGRRFEGYTSEEDSERKILRGVFEPGDAWFRTGDLMRRDADGYFYFVDRIGDTFRWKGENVATSEVAEAICSFPAVREAHVYGVALPGTDGRARMAALVADADAQ